LLCALWRVESSSIPRIAVSTLTDCAAARRSLQAPKLGRSDREGEGSDADASPFGHPTANRLTTMSAVVGSDRRITGYSCSLHFTLSPSASVILERQLAQLERPA